METLGKIIEINYSSGHIYFRNYETDEVEVAFWTGFFKYVPEEESEKWFTFKYIDNENARWVYGADYRLVKGA